MGDIAYYPTYHDRTEVMGGRNDRITYWTGDTTGDGPVCYDCARRNPIGPPARDAYGRFASRPDFGYLAAEMGEVDSPRNCEDCGIPMDFSLASEGFDYLAGLCREELKRGRDAYLSIMDGPDCPRYWRGSPHVSMLHSWVETAGGASAFGSDSAFIARFLEWTDPARFQADAHVKEMWRADCNAHVSDWRGAARGGYFAV